MNSSIWVGEVEGKALVYDPTIQLNDCPHLFLWDPATQEMGKYIAHLTRKRIRPYPQSETANEYAMAYKQWRQVHGDKWLRDEGFYYTTRRQREDALAAQEWERQEDQRIGNLPPAERLVEQHRRRLEKLGKPYHGVRQAKPYKLHRRITHCYNCKRDLDNSVDLECIACNWILCTCGACGCGCEELW